MTRQPPDFTLPGFIVAACAALALLGATQWLAWQEREATAQVIRDLQVLREIADTRAALVDVQNGHRGYVVEGTAESLQPYLDGTRAIRAHAALLRTLLARSPQQQAHLAEFERLLPQRLATAQQIVEARRLHGLDAARQRVTAGAAAREMAALRDVLDRMDRQQGAIFHERSGQQRATLARLAAGAGGITLLLLPGLAVLYLQVRRRGMAQHALLESESRLQDLAQREKETLAAEVAQRTQELQAANAALEHAKLQLQEMATRIVDYQEQERRRLAYELHEDMAQSMTAIRIDLLAAAADPADGAHVQRAVAMLDELVAQTRDMVGRLRPSMLDDLGLPEALEGELAYHARRNAWQTRLRVEPQQFPPLSPNLRTACFRVAQEALYNVAHHARAAHVEVSLALRGGRLELVVEDDGTGFDVDRVHGVLDVPDSFGIAFMRERARQVGGAVEIGRGSSGRGVRVRLEAPVT